MKRLFISSLFLIICLSLISQKPNDYMAAKLNQPTLGAAAFKYGELTTSNTQFLSKNEYRQSKVIIKRFTKNGKFDEQLWNQFYDLLSDEWFRFCYWSLEDNVKLEVDNDQNDYTKPVEQKVIYCNGCTFWKLIK